MESYLVDTNVLLRSVDPASDDHSTALHVVSKLIGEGNLLCVNSQNLIEFWAVATRSTEENGLGFSRETALSEIEKIQQMFILAEDSPAILNQWLQIIRTKQVVGKRVHDARLAAVVLTHGLDAILTFNDRDFRSLGVEVEIPKIIQTES